MASASVSSVRKVRNQKRGIAVGEIWARGLHVLPDVSERQSLADAAAAQRGHESAAPVSLDTSRKELDGLLSKAFGTQVFWPKTLTEMVAPRFRLGLDLLKL